MKRHRSSDTQLCTCAQVIRLDQVSKEQAQGQWIPPKLLIAWCLDCGPAPSSGSGTVNTVMISKALGTLCDIIQMPHRASPHQSSAKRYLRARTFPPIWKSHPLKGLCSSHIPHGSSCCCVCLYTFIWWAEDNLRCLPLLSVQTLSLAWMSPIRLDRLANEL